MHVFWKTFYVILSHAHLHGHYKLNVSCIQRSLCSFAKLFINETKSMSKQGSRTTNLPCRQFAFFLSSSFIFLHSLPSLQALCEHQEKACAAFFMCTQQKLHKHINDGITSQFSLSPFSGLYKIFHNHSGGLLFLTKILYLQTVLLYHEATIKVQMSGITPIICMLIS